MNGSAKRALALRALLRLFFFLVFFSCVSHNNRKSKEWVVLIANPHFFNVTVTRCGVDTSRDIFFYKRLMGLAVDWKLTIGFQIVQKNPVITYPGIA